ncbi:type II secretion system protein GspM [Candidatus Methylocalor cossyra]|uniref:General secretion pathway protein M n=1 Tax=Candidatus Methylocalor cossyra TaxID=3108543 RepID=A0ABM9NKN4_9GAMM
MRDLLKSPLLTRPIPLNKSRLAALALLGAVLLLVHLAIVAPLLGFARAQQETVEDLKFRLQRLRAVAAEKERLVQRLQSLKEAGQEDDRFLTRDTAALASADLQTQIKEAVSEAGGELSSTQVVPEHTEEKFTRVAVKVRMNGSTEVLREVLYSFESAKPLLFVENLNIRPIRMPRNPAAKTPQIPDRLSVDFDVVGYMRAP